MLVSSHSRKLSLRNEVLGSLHTLEEVALEASRVERNAPILKLDISTRTKEIVPVSLGEQTFVTEKPGNDSLRLSFSGENLAL